MRTHRSLAALIVGLGMTLAGALAPVALAQEHPEHPTEHPKTEESAAPEAGSGSSEHPEEGAEHPAKGEHPEQRGEAPAEPVSMEQLAKAIEDYVARDSELKGGAFLVHDPVDDKTLSLELAKVHHDKLARMHEGLFFACADFKNADGTIYDLDLFLTGRHAATLRPTEIAVHKKDGTPRYNWKEEDGNWIKVPVE